MRYSKLELQCLVWKFHVGVPQRYNVHQPGGRKPVETSGVHFGSLKTFFLSAKLENMHIDTFLNIFIIQKSKKQGESIFLCM